MTSAHFRRQNELFYALNRFLNSPNSDSVEAKTISAGYKKLWPTIRGALTVKQKIEIKKLDLKGYTGTKYLQILAELKKYFEKDLKKEIVSLVIHGSVATMDWAEGFSDLDTFAVVREGVCEDSKKLETLRQKIYAIGGLLKKSDPLEHHGFIFCHEGNLDFYHQRFLPVEVFRYAKVLAGTDKITFNIRDSRQENLENFEHYYQIFKNIAATGKITHKTGSPEYQLKWFVSMLLLMPNLYLQAKEIYVYKKFAFGLVNPYTKRGAAGATKTPRYGVGVTHPFLKKLELARKNFSQAEKILGKNYYGTALAMLDQWRKELDRSRTRFTNHPKTTPLKVYDSAREEVVSGLSKNPDVLAIYEYGSVSAPGISDIDLIVALKERVGYKFHYPDGPNIRRVARGGAMLMPEKVFQKLLWLDDLKLKHLYGKRISALQPATKITKLRDLANVLDWLPERMIRLIMILKKQPFDVQYALRYTRSFAYALENATRMIGRKKNESDVFLDKLKNLRADWRPERSSELQALVRAGLYLGCDILREFSEKKFGPPERAEGRLTLFPGQEIVFTADPRKISADWSFARSTQTNFKIFVSSALLPHFAFYAKQGGIIGNGFKNNLVTSKPVTSKLPRAYQKFLKEKIVITNANAAFLKKHGFRSGQYKFGFYLN